MTLCVYCTSVFDFISVVFFKFRKPQFSFYSIMCLFSVFMVDDLHGCDLSESVELVG